MLDENFLIEGEKLNIVSLEDAGESLDEAMSRVNANQVKSTADRLKARMEYLASTGNLRVPNQYNVECDLPDSGKCYAIKAKNIRAYGWHSKRMKHHFVISHYVYKNYQRMKTSDKELVKKNYTNFENV